MNNFDFLVQRKIVKNEWISKNSEPVGTPGRYHQIRKCLIIECNLSAKPREIFELRSKHGSSSLMAIISVKA